MLLYRRRMAALSCHGGGPIWPRKSINGQSWSEKKHDTLEITQRSLRCLHARPTVVRESERTVSWVLSEPPLLQWKCGVLLLLTHSVGLTRYLFHPTVFQLTRWVIRHSVSARSQQMSLMPTWLQHFHKSKSLRKANVLWKGFNRALPAESLDRPWRSPVYMA